MQQCPICENNVHPMQRYPNYICSKCIERYDTLTFDGKPITFSNIDWWGGFQSHIEGDKTPTEIHKCYINGIECWADEARFGGIVIQPNAVLK